ncbi:hypothetical protein BGW41_006260, partial [Actinomortierella wolfii]
DNAAAPPKESSLPTPSCLTCHALMGRMHACLQCVSIGCWKRRHAQGHAKDSGHHLSMEMSMGSLYCHSCGDFVYDRDFDNIRKDEILRSAETASMVQETGPKRPRYARWHASTKEAAVIRANTHLKACVGLRGLRNMGSTCFMNVILQCFIHNPLLRGYFLSDMHSSKRCEVKSDCMGCEMDQLFSQFYSGDKTPYGPTSFLITMWKSSSDLAGYAQQDAHEFFISALNQLHANSPNAKLHNCRCIIHKTFAGVLQSDVTCLNCGNVTSAFDPILDISLDLRPTRRRHHHHHHHHKHNHHHSQSSQPNGASSPLSNGYSNGSSLSEGGSSTLALNGGAGTREEGPNSLADCLDRYTHPERLGTNEYNCSKCGKNGQDATKQLSMKVLPPVLSFQLKRFEHYMGASKIETMIKFPEKLDMTQYTTTAKRKIRNHHKKLAESKKSAEAVSDVDTPNSSASSVTSTSSASSSSSSSPSSAHLEIEPNPSYIYNLFAVINHQGKMDTGHYTAYAKHRGEWFSLDDHKVTMASQREALSSKAYMLFYVKQTLEYEYRQV